MIACLVGAGMVYRAHRLAWVGVLIALPLLAMVIVRGRHLDFHLTEKGMKALHICCVLVTVVLSFTIMMDNHLENRFAHHSFHGRVWIENEGDTNDQGEPVATTEYYAPTAAGRFVLGAYPWAVATIGFIFSFTVHWAFVPSLEQKVKDRLEAERLDYIRQNR